MLLWNKVCGMTYSSDERMLRYKMEKDILVNKMQEKLENLKNTFYPNELNEISVV